MECGQLVLKLLVDVLRAADESDRAQAVAVGRQALVGRLNEARVIR